MNEGLQFLIQVAPLIVLIGIPSVILLRRLGFSGWLAIPFTLFFVVSIWVLALVKWPIRDARTPHSGEPFN